MPGGGTSPLSSSPCFSSLSSVAASHSTCDARSAWLAFSGWAVTKALIARRPLQALRNRASFGATILTLHLGGAFAHPPHDRSMMPRLGPGRSVHRDGAGTALAKCTPPHTHSRFVCPPLPKC